MHSPEAFPKEHQKIKINKKKMKEKQKWKRETMFAVCCRFVLHGASPWNVPNFPEFQIGSHRLFAGAVVDDVMSQ